MRKIVITLLASILAFTMVASAAAQLSNTATVTITSTGALVVSVQSASFGTHPYSFSAQPVTGNIVIGVQDNTGSGAGWNVTLLGGPFSRDANTSFPISNLALAAGTPVRDAGQAVTAGLTTIGLSPVSGTAQKVASATTLNGMGQYTVTSVGTLTIPGGTLIGTYNSTLTVAINSGP